jgi:FdhE protein
VTIDDWLRAHPFLAPIARVRASIDASIDAAVVPHPAVPDWAGYRADFLVGMPLLHSAGAAIDLDAAGGAIVDVAERFGARPLDAAIAGEARELSAALSADPDSARHAVAWLLGDVSWKPSQPGLLRCLGWLTLTAALRPMNDAFASWRDEERWLRRYCPTCGSLPAMAQLVGVDPGRRRLLACGCCGTRWHYKRTACPFCESESQRLASVGIEGEGGLRIDHCESCHVYLKTYDGHGDESVMLADWTSPHLDLVAREKGWHRMAASLYDLGDAQGPSGIQ